MSPGLAKSVLQLAGGSALAQVVAAASLPLLTRLYSPDSFGTLSVYASTLAIAAVVASLKLELSIPLQRTREAATEAASAALRIVVISATAMAILLALFGGAMAERLGIVDFSLHMWFLPLGVFLVGTYQVANNFATREKQFRRVAATKLTQSLAMALIQVLAYPLQGAGLILGNIAGQAAGALSLFRASGTSFREVATSRVSVVAVLRNNWRFPAFTSVSGLINAIGAHLPTLYVAAQFGPTAAGLYGIANRAVFLPASIASASVSSVLYADFASSDPLDVGTKFSSAYRTAVFVVGPAATFGFLSAPIVFPFLFGDDWESAGQLASWVMIWAASVVVGAPAGASLFATHRQAAELTFQLLMLIFRGTVLMVATSYGGLETSVACYSVSSALSWLIYMLWTGRRLGESVGAMLLVTFLALIAALAMNIMLIVPDGAPNFSSGFAMAATAVALAAYYAWLIRRVLKKQ